MMAKGLYEEALPGFQEINQGSAFFEPSQWYEALIYLKLDRLDEADKKLQSIIESKSSYTNRAEKLKKDL